MQTALFGDGWAACAYYIGTACTSRYGRAFEFASTAAVGEATIQARIDKMEGRTRDPKAGIMLRETSERGASPRSK